MTTTIRGTAAVGAALANADVQAKCVAGTASATTAADGTFTLSIADAQRPCVLSVATPDGATLHSVVTPGTGTAVVANITTLTELITASLAQGSAAAFFEAFDAAAQARLTDANVDTATGSVRRMLDGVVDLAGVDPIRDTLVAAHGNTAGNALDQKLDTLGATLARSGTTLAELSEAVANNAGAEAIRTALQPASASCAGLRTGAYRMINLAIGGISQTVALDAQTMTISVPGETESGTLPITPEANEACRFNVDGLSALVSRSGITVINAASMGAPPFLMLPQQTISIAELAGDWNGLGFEAETGELAPTRITLKIDANGVISGAECGREGCTPWNDAQSPVITANPDGSFDITDEDGAQRAHAFKGTDGVVSMFIGTESGFIVASQQKALTLPALGAKNAYWDMSVLSSGMVEDISTFSTTIAEVDATAGTYSRLRDDGRLDSWTINQPAIGLRHRPLTATTAETVSMSLGNTGVIVATGSRQASSYFGVSVTRP
ncbi:hypothetical protein [Cupriavidus sp. AU9028]|uniref:hypothetical protein n=1 Tax=Cupriavidus sp. AU9028 TaxID=2871157 RepID=UPI00351D3800